MALTVSNGSAKSDLMSDQLPVLLGLGTKFRINSTMQEPVSTGQGGSRGELP
jgi:hypothetical protein